VVTVAGQHFMHVKGVYFGATKARSVKVLAASRLQAVAPAHVAGVVDVTVLTSSGKSKTSAADHFTFSTTISVRQVAVGNGGGQTDGCVLTSAGGVQCWGVNNYGQLGDGSTSLSKVPVTVTGLASGVTQVVTGQEFDCALTSTGGVKCWGWEYEGALGNGVDSTGYSDTPVDVTGLTSGVKSIATGGSTVCALLDSGGVECWGNNGSLELGANTTSFDSATPVAIAGLPTGVESVAVGQDEACVLVSDGGVYCWGAMDGATSGTLETATPTAMSGFNEGAQQLSVGSDIGCVVTTDGAVMCWGDNYDGELGVESTNFESATPVAIPGLGSGQASVSVGDGSTCALATAGGVECWGYNYDGTLGDGSEVNSYTPVKVTGISKGALSIATSTYTNCAVMSGGSVECWGYVPVPIAVAQTPVSLPWYG
jgi:alpha-tubulin suppressor-like RCC1 family protein